MSDQVISRLTDVFRETFHQPNLLLKPEMTAADIEGWDSLSHIDLIVAVEREFKIRFTTAEVTSLKNVGELIVIVRRKSG